MAALLAAAGLAFAAESFTPEQQDAIERIVREYLRDHPEVLVEALRAMEAREERRRRETAEAAIALQREALERDPLAPIGGNAAGDVTVVEFFDYACPYCKQVRPAVMELMRTDANLRYVFREFPILGDDSVVASRAALAAWMLDPARYVAFHGALMQGLGGLGETRVLETATATGLDATRLRRLMDDPAIAAAIQRTYDLAARLGISGTPTFVIGRRLVPGAVSVESLRALVAEARRACREPAAC